MFFSISTLHAASTTGLASVYKVTMKKVELCTASTSVSSCVGAVVIGNTEKVVDIASVNAGVAAATFGETAAAGKKHAKILFLRAAGGA